MGCEMYMQACLVIAMQMKLRKGSSLVSMTCLCCVLVSHPGFTLVTDDERPADATSITRNIDAFLLCVHADKLAYVACSPQPFDDQHKLDRVSVGSKNVTIEKHEICTPIPSHSCWVLREDRDV